MKLNDLLLAPVLQDYLFIYCRTQCEFSFEVVLPSNLSLWT